MTNETKKDEKLTQKKSSSFSNILKHAINFALLQDADTTPQGPDSFVFRGALPFTPIRQRS